jgi:hypothetical protein
MMMKEEEMIWKVNDSNDIAVSRKPVFWWLVFRKSNDTMCVIVKVFYLYDDDDIIQYWESIV